MKKVYGCSLRLGRIRKDYSALRKQLLEAHDSGDRSAFEQYHREYVRYCVRYRSELQIPDERIEEMRVELAECEKMKAELAYLDAKIERLTRESEKKKQELNESLLAEDKRGRLKWN